MSEKVKNKNAMHSIFTIFNVAATCVILFLVGMALLYALHTGKWKMIADMSLNIVFIAISLLIAINIHEFGHFVFGKFFKYKLISYRIAFLAWDNQNGKMKFSFKKNKGIGGLCAMLPPEQNLPRYMHCFFYAGGIIFNITSAILVAALSASIANPTGKMNSFFHVFILCSMLLGMFNLIPFMSGNNASDGKLVWSILLKKPFADKLIGVNKMTTQLSTGSRPKDIQMPFPPKVDNPEAYDMILLLYQYIKSLDSQNNSDTIHFANLLEKNIQAFPQHSLPGVYYELCFMACIANDTTQAKYYYDKAGKTLQKDKDVNGLRVKAYYEYYINKDKQATLNFCELALGVADKFPIKGQAVMEKELIERLRVAL